MVSYQQLYFYTFASVRGSDLPCHGGPHLLTTEKSLTPPIGRQSWDSVDYGFLLVAQYRVRAPVVFEIRSPFASSRLGVLEKARDE
jgi:hypothetical protein